MARDHTTFLPLFVECFHIFLEAFEKNCPFKKHGQLEYHNRTMRVRKECGSAIRALNSDRFLRSLYDTLQAWGIGSRGSYLREYHEFVDALRAKKDEIDDLKNLVLGEPDLNLSSTLKNLSALIFSTDIVKNKTKLVSSTKALHHILPDLIVPIDREYTQRFFGWDNTEFQYYQKECFEKAFRSFAWIANKVNLDQYISEGWNTSRTKVIDNAIIGWDKGGVELIKDYIKIGRIRLVNKNF
jgi:hypothetical protein